MRKDSGSRRPSLGHQSIFISVVLTVLVVSACGPTGGLSTNEQASVGAPELRPWPYSQLPAAKANLRAAGGKLVPEFTDTSEAVRPARRGSPRQSSMRRPRAPGALPTR
jgi:hypothetical protein